MTLSDLTQLPPVETARLRLRPLTTFDAEAFRVLTDEPAITDAVHFLSPGLTLADARRLIAGEEDGRDCFWGAWRRNDPLLIGAVGAHLRGSEEIEIGYWFAGAAQGQGLASEAVGAVVTALQAACRERWIFAECRPENAASWRLLLRLGFAAEGIAGVRPGRERMVKPDARRG